MNPTLTLVVPTYNERENLIPLVQKITAALEPTPYRAEILIVDDNSPDGTAQVAESLDPRYGVRVLRRSGKLGLSSAVIAGWKEAKGRLLGVIDADLSHDPAILPDMIYSLLEGGADIALGSRYAPGGGVANWPWFRRFTSWVAIMLGRPICPARDVTSGYLLMKREVIEGVELNPIGFKINLEVMIKGRYATLCEAPFTFVDRQLGRSKFGSGEILNYLRQLAQLYWYCWRYKPNHRAIPYTPYPRPGQTPERDGGGETNLAWDCGRGESRSPGRWGWGRRRYPPSPFQNGPPYLQSRPGPYRDR